MSLYDKIKSLYPNVKDIDFLTVITLQNDTDGKGDYIAQWAHPIYAQPTQKQLDAAK